MTLARMHQLDRSDEIALIRFYSDFINRITLSRSNWPVSTSLYVSARKHEVYCINWSLWARFHRLNCIRISAAGFHRLSSSAWFPRMDCMEWTVWSRLYRGNRFDCFASIWSQRRHWIKWTAWTWRSYKYARVASSGCRLNLNQVPLAFSFKAEVYSGWLSKSL